MTCSMIAMILLGASIRGRMTIAEEASVYLDSALGFLLIATILVLVHGETALALPTVSGIVALAYPTAFIGLGVAGLVGLAAARYAPMASGAVALASGVILVGCAYLGSVYFPKGTIATIFLRSRPGGIVIQPTQNVFSSSAGPCTCADCPRIPAAAPEIPPSPVPRATSATHPA